MNLNSALSHPLPAARRAAGAPVLGRPAVAATLASALAVASGAALMLADASEALAGQGLLGAALALAGLHFFLWRDELHLDQRLRLYRRHRDYAGWGGEREGALRDAHLRLRTAHDADGFGVYFVLELQFPDAPPLLLGHYATRPAARAAAKKLAERHGLKGLGADNDGPTPKSTPGLELGLPPLQKGGAGSALSEQSCGLQAERREEER